LGGAGSVLDHDDPEQVHMTIYPGRGRAYAKCFRLARVCSPRRRH
jgi:hypothetical protein